MKTKSGEIGNGNNNKRTEMIMKKFYTIFAIAALMLAACAEPEPEQPVVPTPTPDEEAEQKPAAPAPKAEPQKPAEPERKRERRVVDTSAVQVNANRFNDVDNLVSERVQNFQGGKQRIGGGKGKQQQKQQRLQKHQLKNQLKHSYLIKITYKKEFLILRTLFLYI